jgi:hypothetical protein
VNKKEMVNELNKLLRTEKLNLPSFRKQVNKSGKNVAWLVKHIGERNEGYNSKIDDLLAQLNGA